MAKIKTDDWRNLPIEKWNTRTVHAYLIARNKDEYGVEYVPFGKGPVGKRWQTEQGTIKRELDKRGPAVIKRYIDVCFDTNRFNPDYPVLSWGFMYAYKRTELERAQVNVKKSAERDKQAEETRQQFEEFDDDWF